MIEGILKQVPNLVSSVGLSNTLMLIFSGILVYYCAYLVRANTKSIQTNEENLQRKLKLVEDDQRACHVEREAYRKELTTTKLRNDELNLLNREAQRQLKESEVARQTTMDTFTRTVEQFMANNE